MYYYYYLCYDYLWLQLFIHPSKSYLLQILLLFNLVQWFFRMSPLPFIHPKPTHTCISWTTSQKHPEHVVKMLMYNTLDFQKRCSNSRDVETCTIINHRTTAPVNSSSNNNTHKTYTHAQCNVMLRKHVRNKQLFITLSCSWLQIYYDTCPLYSFLTTEMHTTIHLHSMACLITAQNIFFFNLYSILLHPIK